MNSCNCYIFSRIEHRFMLSCKSLKINDLYAKISCYLFCCLEYILYLCHRLIRNIFRAMDDVRRKAYADVWNLFSDMKSKGFMVNAKTVRKNIRNLKIRIDRIADSSSWKVSSDAEFAKVDEVLSKLSGQLEAYREVLKNIGV